jgi:hypothetical protein
MDRDQRAVRQYASLSGDGIEVGSKQTKAIRLMPLF